MRIIGFTLCFVAILWLVVSQLAVDLPKAGNYSERVKRLPIQDSYTRQQVRDVIWEVAAFRWSFPDQETYTRAEVTNMLLVSSMNSHMRDYSQPPVAAPITLLVIGTFILGVGFGKHTAKPSA